VRRLPFAGSRIASCCAVARAGAHLFLAEGQELHLATFVVPVKKTPAQERQFLDPDAISSYQGEIGPDRTFGPYSVVPDAFKREYAESHVLRESGQNELHLSAPSNVIPLLQVVVSEHHKFRGECRLQAGSYSRIRRSCRDDRRASSQTSKTNPVGCRFMSDV
jgi:hypothetical protein